MRKHYQAIYIIILSGIILFLISCSTGSCYEETESFVKASFYDNITKSNIAPDSITLYGLNLDTLKIYDNSKEVDPANFPLDPKRSDCSFILIINDITDTIEFIYHSYPVLISKECGYTFYHNIDSIKYTENAIDYIFINKNNITTLNEENIRIFY